MPKHQHKKSVSNDINVQLHRRWWTVSNVIETEILNSTKHTLKNHQPSTT